MNEALVWTVDNCESQSHFCVNGLYVHSTFELPFYNREKLFQKEQLLLDTLTDFTQICFAILSCGGYQKRIPMMPLSNQITSLEPNATSADCHGTSPLHRLGDIPSLAFLVVGYRWSSLINCLRRIYVNRLRP